MTQVQDDAPKRRVPVVTTTLVVLCVAAFVFELTLPRYGLTVQGFHAKVGAVPFELAHGYDVPPADLVPWWATAAVALLIHGSWLHLAVNMLYLVVFGARVEARLGSWRFLVLYLVCGLVATRVQVAASSGSAVPVIGASGAVAGVLGAYVAVRLRVRVPAVAAPARVAAAVPPPLWILLGVWFGLQALQGVLAPGHPHVAVAFAAHACGFLAGLALGVPLDRLGHARRPSSPGLGGGRSV